MQTMKLPTGKLRYTLTNDYLFHIVFQKNKTILRGLIRSLLNLRDDEIVDIKLENPIHPGDNLNDKSIVLDLLITLNGDRKLNIEMQILNRKDWPERSLTYLSKSFDKLEAGDDYMNVMQTIHIGILDFTLFPDYPEFYAHYAMKNVNNDNIYSDKMLINVLDLTRMDLATDEDKKCGLLHWAKLFKAQTWEDIHMLVSSYKDIENIVDVMIEAMADKEVRMQCEARQRYERDQRSLYNLAIQEGRETGFKTGHAEGHAEGLAEGLAQGHTEGHAQGIIEGIEQGIATSIVMLQDSGIPKENAILQLMNHFQLSTEEAVSKMDSYWK